MSNRILVIVEKDAVPSENFIHREVTELQNIGYPVTILALNGSLSYSPAALFHLKNIFQTAASTSYSISRSIKYLLPISNLSRSIQKPDLIISHFATITAFIGNALSKIWQIPHFCSVHANDIFVPAACGINSIKRSDEIITCSSAAFNKVKSMLGPDSRLNMFYHGIDLSDFDLSLSNRKNIIFFGGRFQKKKGLEFLIKAFKIFSQGNPDYSLLICGEGPEALSLKSLTAELQLSNKVKISGFLSQDQLKDNLKSCKLLCHPSVTADDGDMDGIPNIIIEAMALGTPVLSSHKTGGIPEIISNNENGFLAEPENPENIALRLNEIVSGKFDLLKVTENARNLVADKFDICKNIKKLDTLIQKYLK
ncbi:MAG: glycosyltransferase family 4 protein [Planctomycetota bacterium]|jgi:glycosyltransferase involved in cell wall biosynthesis